jgi:hypothetical protein
MSNINIKILKNNQLDTQLLEDGYVVVPFLSSENINHLISFFKKNHPTEIEGFYATAHSSNIDFRKQMNQEIKSVFEDSIEKYFNECQALGGSFVVKSNKNSDLLQPHQDWNIVDENEYRSFNIWVPLVDLSEENGAIMVLPKSHRWFKNYRGPNIPNYLSDKQDEILNKMKTLNMKAGEALIYDHRLFHSSHPNISNDYRIATVFGIIPKVASMKYYFGRNENVEIYESSVDFFMEGNIQQGPEILKKIGEVDNSKIIFREKTLYDNAFKKSFWDKLKTFVLK